MRNTVIDYQRPEILFAIYVYMIILISTFQNYPF